MAICVVNCRVVRLVRSCAVQGRKREMWCGECSVRCGECSVRCEERTGALRGAVENVAEAIGYGECSVRCGGCLVRCGGRQWEAGGADPSGIGPPWYVEVRGTGGGLWCRGKAREIWYLWMGGWVWIADVLGDACEQLWVLQLCNGCMRVSRSGKI